MKHFYIFFLAVVLFAVPVIAQEDTTGNNSVQEWEDFESWDIMDDTASFSLEQPTIEIQWSATKPTLNNSTFSFAPIGTLDLKIGTTEKKSDKHKADIIEYDFNYLLIGNMTQSLSSTDKKPGEVEIASWRFGLGSSSGLGYKIGSSSDLTLYHSSALNWQWIDSKGEITDSFAINIMNAYGNKMRFGTNFEGGINFQIFEPVSLKAAYERVIVFPRHLFWYWLTSEIIEGVGQELIGLFVDEVMDRSPYAGPVVFFILKNALSYGFYELREKKMNWPFNTVSPIMFENFKVGLSLAF